jgi:hypothetical protein
VRLKKGTEPIAVCGCASKMHRLTDFGAQYALFRGCAIKRTWFRPVDSSTREASGWFAIPGVRALPGGRRARMGHAWQG